MALTPEDVVNKRFQQTKFREGYDQDEVDDFLDEVTAELRRLIDENKDLRKQLAEAREGRGSATETREEVSGDTTVAPVVAADEQVTETPTETTAEVVEVEEAVSAPAVARVSEPASTSASPSTGSGDVDESHSLLLAAKQVHDQVIAEGRQRSASIVADAESRAAQIKADAERAQQETMSKLEGDRSQLEQRIEELRQFERDYRSQLRTYIEGQLKDLDAQPAGSAN